MAGPIVTPTNHVSNIAQEAYELVTLNSRQNFDAINAILEKLNIEMDDDLLSVLCDLEQTAFLSGFAMCEGLRNVPLLAGGD